MTEPKWYYAGDRLRFVEREGRRILQQRMILADPADPTIETLAEKWVDVPLESEQDERDARHD